ncbi:MAG TPA: NADH-quinone oxidoreductase subunit J [Candidatus Limnocylindria bacterium]|nr:NADH-quinone oxidoreductase subunit J [Candidatus Limnocylindria bacterium]
MTTDQLAFGVAGAVSIIGAVTAVTHREPRAAGAALLATLLSLAVLYASLAAPLLAGIVVVLALFATVPLFVHFTVPAPRGHRNAPEPPTVGAAAVVGATLLVLLTFAIAYGDVPVNVSVRSADGYDLAALGALVTGRAASAAMACGVVLLVAIVGAGMIRRSPR